MVQPVDDQPPPRAVRPEPARVAPDRSGWKKPAGAPPPPDAEPPTAGADPEISKIVADIVRIGYDVIGENLRQGRAAADRHSSGHYRLEDVPDDLTRLGNRLLQLSRDLSTTCFDLAGAVLRDPGLRAAVAPREAPPPPDPRKPGPTPLTCVFRGSRQASAEATSLAQPDAPTLLATAGLHPVDAANAPPLTRIVFGRAGIGDGVIATIAIPEDQPAGLYSGVIHDAASHKPLGALTVRILA